MSLLSENDIIRDTYIVERFLGEGAFAEVYRVRHRFLGRQAMKVFKLVGMTVEETEDVLGEAVILSRIGHPNIIRVFDANTIEAPKGTCGFFTMEYVAGGSLDQFWRSFGTRFVPIETAVEVIRQVSRGLAVAHSENPPIIHRDIKPQNILVGYDASGVRIRVSDFGLARRVNPLTLLASAKGTRSFKPPEIFRDYESDSRAGDVWAVGTTLYLLLADRVPFPELGEIDLLDGRCFERPVIPPSRINLQVDPALDQIVLRTLALKPEDRYQTAGELLVDLERWEPRPADSLFQPKTEEGSDSSKNALGEMLSPANEERARKLISEALNLAGIDKLGEAADMMEEAFNKWPDLRDRYEYQVKLWRRGIIR